MIATGIKLGTAICEALGIDPKTVTDIRIDCDVGSPAMVTVGRLVTVDEANQISALVEQYRLVEEEGDMP